MGRHLSLAWRVLRVALVRLRFVGIVALAAAVAATADDWSSLARGLLGYGRLAVGEAPPRYACPMHPEVVGERPGPCSKCGMPLVSKPETAVVHTCPMHPEVTGAPGGDCPQCGMRLVRRETAPAVEYFCPMHPDAVRGEPGKCPACGMPLRRREEGELAHVALTPERARLGGLDLAHVQRRTLEREVVAPANLELDERRVARLSTPLRAVIQSVNVAAAGQAVRRGEVIAQLASRDLFAYGRDLQRDVPDDEAGVVIARQRLLQIGLTPAQIDRVRRYRDPTRFDLLAPIDGVLVTRTATLGDQVPELTPLFTIADLSRLWLVARVFEEDALLVRPGMTFEAQVLADPGVTLRAEVTWIDAVVDPQTRTLAVRADIPNPGGRLRPGMAARAIFHVVSGSPSSPPLVVPDTAVVDTGLRQVVWREDEDGTLEAVEVMVSARAGGLVAIGSGLDDGDRVVTDGAFLLSADLRLRSGGKPQMGVADRAGAGGGAP